MDKGRLIAIICESMNVAEATKSDKQFMANYIANAIHYYFKDECFEWINVLDRLPEKGQWCIVNLPNNEVTVAEFCDFTKKPTFAIINCIGSTNDVEYGVPITHWMPLPLSPNKL